MGIVTDNYPSREHFEEGTFVKDLSDELVKSGCETTVIHYRRDFAAMFMETLLRRGDFDILDAQFVAPSGVIASLTPKLSPLVITVHRWDIFEFPHRWPTASQWTKFALHRADGVIAVSKYVANEIAKFTSEHDKIHILPNAVDTFRFRPLPESDLRARLGISDSSLLISSIGRLTPIKGFDYLLRALHQLVGENYDVKLIIAGEGAWRPHYESLTRALNLQDHVRFAGRVRHEDPALVELYSASDVFALTSMMEGQSVAIMEAMACGKPVVCSDIPANREAVVQGFNGILVPPKDSQKIAAAIKALYTSRELVREYGKNSRTLALRTFSWSRRIEALLWVYESLLKSSSRRRRDS